jgi:hypothetical protein
MTWRRRRGHTRAAPAAGRPGINEAAEFAERESDHQHDEQIDRAVDAAEQHLGQGNDQQGNKA